MATVFDVATYILKRRKKMSSVKLQRLCYYSQAWSLVWEDAPLFEEEFYAWDFGPICKELYDATEEKFILKPGDLPGNDGALAEAQKSDIDDVLDYYADLDTQWLSRLTRLERPWKEARRKMNPKHPYDSKITKISMASYYDRLSEDGEES